MSDKSVLAIDGLEEKERSKRTQIPYLAETLKLDPIDYSANFQLKRAYTTTLATTATQQSEIKIPSSSRPTLPLLKQTKQSTALGIEIAKAIQRNEKILQNMVEILIKNIHVHNETIIKLSKEDEEKLNKLLEQLSKTENVDTVKRLLNIVTSATAITIGSLLLAPETITAITATATGSVLYSSVSSIWAYLMIGSGVSNIITNEILPRLGGFEKLAGFFTSSDANKKNLADNIQITASLTTSIMGIISSVATSPLIGAVLDWNKGLKILNTTLELSTGTTNFIYDINEYSLNRLQAAQTKIDGKLSKEQTKLDNAFTKLHSAADIQQTFNKTAFQIFETLKKIQENNTR